MHEDVAALLPEMREYFAGIPPHERPMSLDNWAAMVGRTYVGMRVALRHLDKDFLAAYIAHRKRFYRLLEEELLALPDYTAQYTTPIREKYGVTKKDMLRIRARLGLRCAPKKSYTAAQLVKFIKVGMTIAEIAEAAGMTMKRVKSLANDSHLDPYVEFHKEKRLCRNGAYQPVRVVTRLKTQEKTRDRSKSRR